MRRPSKHLDHLALAIRATYDVALIAVLFLLVTGKMREYFIDTESPDIRLPYAETPYIMDFDNYGATIYVWKDKVMFELPDTLKKLTLLAIGEKYGINFSKRELEQFRKMKVIPVPIHELKNYIHDFEKEPYYIQNGLKINSTIDELADWIKESEIAYDKINGIGKLRFNIYADSRLKYSQIKLIFNTLGDQGIHHFYLITWSTSKSTDHYVE